MSAGGATIAAISTAAGRAAVAIVRVSGPGTRAVATALGLGDLQPRIVALRGLTHPENGRLVDRVLTTFFAAPASYTGEDMLEIGCHGGSLGPQLVLDAVCAGGARVAQAGEFTRRALLNGKIDLVQAEATLDLIDARTPALQRAALFQLERGLSKRVERIRERVLELQGLVAYEIDFPGEDDGPVPAAKVEAASRSLQRELAELLELAPEGELLRDGALTVLAGRPNAGKSSIFNALLGIDRAIVTEEPGTTRDAIEALVSVEGYPFRLVDTAGLRQDPDRVERMGIEVARSYLRRADVALLCAEDGRPLGDDEVAFLQEMRSAEGGPPNLVLVRTKTDLIPEERANAGRRSAGTDSAMQRQRPDPARSPRAAAGPAPRWPTVRVSTITGRGLPELRTCLLDMAFCGLRQVNEVPLVTRERHARRLREARERLAEFECAYRDRLPPEIAVTHLHDATVSLEELLGTVTTEDVLEIVFRDFCVGK